MKKSYRGIFPLNERMPCAPSELRLRRYALSSTVGIARSSEEIAVRILLFSQERGEWVGINLDCLMKSVKVELTRYVRAKNRKIHNGQAMKLFGILRAGHHFLLRLCGRKSGSSKDFLVWESQPQTGVTLHGPEFVFEGLEDLQNNGMLRVANGVFFPTSKLVAYVLTRQRVQRV